MENFETSSLRLRTAGRVALSIVLTICCSVSAAASLCSSIINQEAYAESHPVESPSFQQLKRDRIGSPSFSFFHGKPALVEKAIELNSVPNPTDNRVPEILALLFNSNLAYELSFRLKDRPDTKLTAVISEFHDNRGGVYSESSARYSGLSRLFSRPIFIVEGRMVFNIAADRIIPESIEISVRRPEVALDSASLSQSAAQLGILGLRHSLRGDMKSQVASLAAILSSHTLDGISNHKEGERRANYLMLESQYDAFFAQRGITMHFNTRLLDRNDYYLNEMWQFGAYNPMSIRFDQIEQLRTVFYFYGQGLIPGSMSHELVFLQPFDLEQLEKIEVPLDWRDSVIAELISRDISPPAGKTWDDFVRVRNIRSLPFGLR